ncbi:hypothetical protein B0H17DRAFT_1149271 [Mycena rosella]|uniref:Uncharacterized protein n=1 Tax=Mycena rosella TaxID=1033263 RepID=A0AAD7C4V7_MYCRO|nr:hypothetical protein B0H17DRAFT_1149271 [Mycena rosella]
MQAHLMRNAEAYLSKMEVVGAHPYNTQGRGACKVHMGKVVAVGAERSDTQGQSGTRAAVEGKIFYYMGIYPTLTAEKGDFFGSACGRGMSHTCQKRQNFCLPAAHGTSQDHSWEVPTRAVGRPQNVGGPLKNTSLGLVIP